MSKVEEPVTPEAATPVAIGDAAFAAARASIQAQSQDHGQTDTVPPKVDDTSTETPAQEPETVADEPPETTPDDAILNADELAKLSPKERAQAEKWQGKLTRRAQELSAKEKQYEQWKPLIDGMSTDADGTLEQLAKSRGFNVVKPGQDTTVKTEIQSRFTKAIDALAPEIRPLFQPALEALGQEIMSSVEGQIRPMAEAHTQMISETSAAETMATEKAFEAKYADYRKVEPQMLELAKKFVPVAGAMEDFEYLEHLYGLVKAKQSKVEQIKETIRDINKSVASVEPNSPGVREGSVEETMPANYAQMTPQEQIRAAYGAASRGKLWKK